MRPPRHITEDVLESFRIDYEASGYDAYYVWGTIRWCFLRDVPFPSWVMTYLETAANRIHSLSAELDPKVNAKVPAALGFTAVQGKETSFAAVRRNSVRQRVCLDFATHILEGATFEAAIAGAARTNRVEPSALKKWVREFFPERQPRQQWREYLAAATDEDGPAFNRLLRGLLATRRRRPAS